MRPAQPQDSVDIVGSPDLRYSICITLSIQFKTDIPMSTAAEPGPTPFCVNQQSTARRVRIPAYQNSFQDVEHLDWELPHVNDTHLVSRHSGNFDVQAWKGSIAALLEKHPILNARLEIDSGGGSAFVLDDRPPDVLTIVDLRAYAAAQGQMTLPQLAASLVWQPFDRKGGRLIRAFMISVSDQERVLGMVVHHSIADGWSIAIIGRELLSGYAALISGRHNTLPHPQIHFLDYIEWKTDWLQGPDARLQEQYWTRQMADARSIRLPRLSGTEPDVAADWAVESFTLDPEVVRALCKHAGKLQTTPFLLLLTAKLAALAAIVGSCDIVIDIAAEQRSDPRLRNTVGHFINILPIRAAVRWSESFDDLVAKVQTTYLEARANQTYPYRLIQPHGVFPLFLFRRVIGESRPPEVSAGGFQFFELPPPPPIRTTGDGMGHSMVIQQTGMSMSGRVDYLPTLYRKETVANFLRVFCGILQLGTDESTQPRLSHYH
jgi:hypothetical protein